VSCPVHVSTCAAERCSQTLVGTRSWGSCLPEWSSTANCVVLLDLALTHHTNFTSYINTTTTTLHPFNGLFSTTTWASWHQKGKPFWILLEQEMMGWQWHQLDHMQIICTSLQTDNHTSTSPLRVFTRRMLFQPLNQQSVKALKANYTSHST